MEKKIVFVLFLLSAGCLYGQNEVHSKITVLSGNSAFFPFNSYTKMNDGMQYTDWTRLRVLYFDTIADGSLDAASRWELLVRANTSDIPGDGGITPMNLDKVELLIALTTDDGTITTVATHTITDTDAQIVGNGANPTGRDIGVTI